MKTLAKKPPGKPKTEAACASGCCGDIIENENKQSPPEWNIYVPTLVSFVLLLSGITLNYFEVNWFSGNLELVWFIVAYLPVGAKVLWYAAKNIGKGQVFNEFFLMGIATLGAFFIAEYAEAVAVMLFYVVGEHFQDAAVKKSRKSIKALIDNRPESVHVLRNGIFTTVDPKTVKLGETIQIKAGEKVALDGKITSEGSSFNTSALTGESKPDFKQKGEKVLAGMINLGKVVEMEVSADFENTALSKILLLVEQANTRKAKPQKFITRFAKVYTPIVFFSAVALTLIPSLIVENYVFEDWLYRALVFLVVSCPCALVISIPLGYFGGIGAASKNGILFKGANFLDLMTKIDAVVFDKTGTLTMGVFEVQKVQLAKNSEIDEQELIAFTSALESQSNHPVARAISAYAKNSHSTLKVSEAEEIPGFGIKGKVAEKEILAGNTKLLEKFNIEFDPELDKLVDTVVVVAVDGKYAGYLSIADKMKKGVSKTVKDLHHLGIKEIVMLSGDKPSVVNNVAKKLNIDKAFGGLLPHDKVSKLEELKKTKKNLVFVGDGINDAPVITLADVGIAMGGLGSDAAIETADVVIQNDQPSKVVTAIGIAKKTKQVVWQNIGLAFGIKALILTLAAFGMASLWGAVFADVGVALLAILNAVRIQWIDFEQKS